MKKIVLFGLNPTHFATRRAFVVYLFCTTNERKQTIFTQHKQPTQAINTNERTSERKQTQSR